jgi:DNA-binding NarL/FixJ family response regulator
VSRDPGDTASPRFALEASGADPATAAEATDQIQHLLSLLDTTQLRIVRWKLDGLSNSAIAAELGVVERTIERKTELIRSLWEQTLLS